jgi:hypothetical protein
MIISPSDRGPASCAAEKPEPSPGQREDNMLVSLLSSQQDTRSGRQCDSSAGNGASLVEQCPAFRPLAKSLCSARTLASASEASKLLFLLDLGMDQLRQRKLLRVARVGSQAEPDKLGVNMFARDENISTRRRKLAAAYISPSAGDRPLHCRKQLFRRVWL